MSKTIERFVSRLQEAKASQPKKQVLTPKNPKSKFEDRKQYSKAKKPPGTPGRPAIPKEAAEKARKKRLEPIIDQRAYDLVDAAMKHVDPKHEDHFRHWAHATDQRDEKGELTTRAREHARLNLAKPDAKAFSEKYYAHREEEEAKKDYEETVKLMRSNESAMKAALARKAKQRERVREPEAFPEKFNPRIDSNHTMHMQHIDATNESLGKQVGHIQHHANQLLMSTNKRDQEHHAKEFIRHVQHYSTHGRTAIQNMRDANAEHSEQQKNDDIDAGMSSTKRNSTARFVLTGKDRKRQYSVDEKPSRNSELVTNETKREMQQRSDAINNHSARRAENVANALISAIGHPAINKHQAVSMVRGTGLVGDRRLRTALREKGVSHREVRRMDIERHPIKGRLRSAMNWAGLTTENSHLETLKRIISEVRENGEVTVGKRGARGHDNEEKRGGPRKIRGRFQPRHTIPDPGARKGVRLSK